MDVTLIADSLTAATAQGLGLLEILSDRHQYFASNSHLSLCDATSADNFGLFQVTAAMLPVDAVAPPPVKSSYKTAKRTLLIKKRRAKRRLSRDGGSDEGEDFGFFGVDGSGPFGGSRGGGGGGGGWSGGGWNFDGFGGQNWDESSSSSSWSGPALDFVYEVIYWIALANCVHFALKKLLRIFADGIGDTDREKVPMRLTSVC